jgi:hypothetical protein
MKNENFKMTDSTGTMLRVSEGRSADDATAVKRRQNALPSAPGARPQLFTFHFSFFILPSTPVLSPYRSSSRFLKTFNSFS